MPKTTTARARRELLTVELTPGYSPGAWSATLRAIKGERVVSTRELSGTVSEPTTMNRMALLAMLEGLFAIKQPSRVRVYSQSRYLIEPMTKGWFNRWVEKGQIEQRPNGDLWWAYQHVSHVHRITFHLS